MDSRAPSREAEGPRADAAPAVVAPRQQPLRAADRRAINATLDRFLPTAVARRHVADSYDLVTPGLRAGMTRAAWAKGDIPVYPYPLRPGRYHGWTLNDFSRGAVSFDLLLQPRRDARVDPIAFTVRLKHVGGRWLVDSFAPTAIFYNDEHRVLASPDFEPQAVDPRHDRAQNWMWAIPAAFGVLIAAVPLGLFLAARRRNRRARRLYGPVSRELPPLPVRRS
jgi:hypothetical protein